MHIEEIEHLGTNLKIIWSKSKTKQQIVISQISQKIKRCTYIILPFGQIQTLYTGSNTRLGIQAGQLHITSWLLLNWCHRHHCLLPFNLNASCILVEISNNHSTICKTSLAALQAIECNEYKAMSSKINKMVNLLTSSSRILENGR